MANDLGRLYETARHVVGSDECHLCITIRFHRLLHVKSDIILISLFAILLINIKIFVSRSIPAKICLHALFDEF